MNKARLGIGWRPELALAIERRTDLEFVEVVAENWSPSNIPEPIDVLRSRGLTVIPHGISLSLGGAEPPSTKRLRHLNAMAKRLQSPFVSEHIAFVRSGKLESGHLLPLPRTRKTLNVVIENILMAKEELEVPLVLENIAYLCEWRNCELSEAEFVTEILEQTDSMMLLDVANLYANAVNHGFDPVAYLQAIPSHRVAYVHVAGGVVKKGMYHDTHAHDVTNGVYKLLGELCNLHMPPRIMLERDDKFPTTESLYEELNAIKHSASNDFSSMGSASTGSASIGSVSSRTEAASL